jgi:hypothetical protein
VGILKKSTNQLGDEPSGQVFCKLPVALQADFLPATETGPADVTMMRFIER